jgi:phage major head subunit gpT-like protein
MSEIHAPTALVKGIRALLLSNVAAMSGLLGRLSMLQSSDSDEESYGWLGEPPRMREIGDDDQLIYDGMSDAQYDVENKIWAAGLRIPRKHWDDQKGGLIARRVQQLARVAANHVNRLSIQGLIEADTALGYDGVAMVSNSHPARGQQTAAQDNLLGGTGTTTAQIQADIGDAIETILSFIAENGEPYTEEITKVGISYPVAIHRQVLEATKAVMISNTSNVMSDGGFAFDLVPSARLQADDVNDFYVWDASVADDLPIIIQERDGLEVSQKLDGDDAFDNEIYKFKVRWRGNKANGHWQRISKIAN